MAILISSIVKEQTQEGYEGVLMAVPGIHPKRSYHELHCIVTPVETYLRRG